MSEGKHAMHAAEGPMRVAADQELVRVRRKRKGSKHYRPLLLGTLAVLSLFVIVIAGVALWGMTLQRSMSIDEGERESLQDALAQAADPVTGTSSAPARPESSAFYALLVGSDERDGLYGARGDVLVLVRVDLDNSVIHLVSIPRDTMVTIPGVIGTQKINASYHLGDGGAARAVRTISEFAGVPISHYAEVDFVGVQQVVDSLGGVWVDVPEAVTTNSGAYFPAGDQLLDGQRALMLARERYHVTGGDFGRASMQRQIIAAIIRQILQSSPAEVPGLVTKLAEAVSTDYSVPELIQLAMDASGTTPTIYSCVCPSYAIDINGVSYVAPMFDRWQDMMRRVDAGLDPNDTSQEIPEPQASDTTLGAAPNSPAEHDYQGLLEDHPFTTDLVTDQGI